MNEAEKILARWIDERKLTGEEAVIIFSEIYKQQQVFYPVYPNTQSSYNPVTSPTITWTTTKMSQSTTNSNQIKSYDL